MSRRPSGRTVGRTGRVVLRGTALAVAAAVAGARSVVAAALVAGETPGDAWRVAPGVGAAATGALVWPLARRRADAAVERLVHGSRRTPDEVVRAFEAASGRNLPLSDLLVQLAESLVRSFVASEAAIWRVDDHTLVPWVAVPSREAAAIELDEPARRVLAGSGVVGRAWLELWVPDLLAAHPGEVRVVPATHAGAVLGVVLVARVPGAERFEAADDAALAELGGRVGVVLHNRQLDAALQATLEDLRRTNEELRASRVRLVSTADAERRRIERDLHDGAQQHLVALAVNLRLADDAIADDPSVAREVLGTLGNDVRAAIAELRSLAHGIFPPLLMDAGIIEALRVAAERAAPGVTFTSDGVGRYAPEVETAVYFCCLEALQNAAKHAPGSQVRVHVVEQDGAVRFTVDDDGPGLGGAAAAPGHGLSNMADRVGALGGTLEVGAAPEGGTRVAGAIPVGAESPGPVVAPDAKASP